MYTVYLRTNTINEMKYVGQAKNFKRRQRDWRCLKEKYANLFLTEDRARYGLDGFTTQVLAEVETQSEAWELEKKFIKELNTLYPNGYNISKGGKYTADARKGMKHTEETKRKMRESRINGKNSKPVLQLDKDTGEVIREWPSTREVQRQLGYAQTSICNCCNGKRYKSAYGFKWSYA